MRLVRTRTYRSDIEQIVDYISADSPSAALVVWDEIETQLSTLMAHPFAGRSGRVDGTRELVVNRTAFVIAYQVSNDQIIALRVLHGSKQWPDDFGS